MRNAKKIIFTIVALLPLIPFVWELIPRVGNDAFNAPKPVGTVSVAPTNDFFVITPDSVASELYSEWLRTNENPADNAFGNATFGFFQMLADVGLPVNFYTITAYFLMVYYFLLILISFVVDLITFPIRKGSEIFGG